MRKKPERRDAGPRRGPAPGPNRQRERTRARSAESEGLLKRPESRTEAPGGRIFPRRFVVRVVSGSERLPSGGPRVRLRRGREAGPETSLPALAQLLASPQFLWS